MKIKIKESIMILPASQYAADQQLWLSNIDILLSRMYISLVCFFKSPIDSYNRFDLNVIKETISKVTVSYYPIAGRLGIDENGRLQMNCGGQGVLFIEAEADSTIDELRDVSFEAETSHLLPALDYYSINSSPLFALQVTKLACGGLSLGLKINHVLGDGTAISGFIKTCCEAAHGLPTISSPLIDRTLLSGRIPPNPKFHRIEYQQSPAMNTSSQNPICTESFRIIPYQLNILKTKINNDSKMKHTTYEILTAHIWRCACKARGLSNDQPTKCIMVVDGRPRLDPPILPGYLGNVLFFAVDIALSGELISVPLKDSVERISKAIMRMDNEYLRSAIDYLEVGDHLETMMQGLPACRGPNLGITSLMRMPFYDVDFGMGKPIHVRMSDQTEGRGYILPHSSNDGSLELSICLNKDHMQSFRKIF